MNRGKNGPESKPSQDGNGENQKDRGIAYRPERNWKSQLIGAGVGVLIALVISGILRELGYIEGNPITYALWGGVIGGLFGGSDDLARAGSRLTRRDERWLNIIVALLGFLGWVVNRLFRSGAFPLS